MAYLNKSDIEYITKNITPEETAYVTGIASTLYDTQKNSEISSEYADHIIYITKLLSFSAAFNVIYNSLSDEINREYKCQIGDLRYYIEDYIRMIKENIQSIIGIINASDITKVELPVSNNPLELINELKICVNNWFLCIKDNIEFEGCKFITSQFLSQIHRSIYLFRLYKNIDQDKSTDEAISPSLLKYSYKTHGLVH